MSRAQEKATKLRRPRNPRPRPKQASPVRPAPLQLSRVQEKIVRLKRPRNLRPRRTRAFPVKPVQLRRLRPVPEKAIELKRPRNLQRPPVPLARKQTFPVNQLPVQRLADINTGSTTQQQVQLHQLP